MSAARAGLDVLVLEADKVVGGAARTERPFARVPGLRHSTGAYLLGLMPPELLRKLDVRLDVGRPARRATTPTVAPRSASIGARAARSPETVWKRSAGSAATRRTSRDTSRAPTGRPRR